MVSSETTPEEETSLLYSFLSSPTNHNHNLSINNSASHSSWKVHHSLNNMNLNSAQHNVNSHYTTTTRTRPLPLSSDNFHVDIERIIRTKVEIVQASFQIAASTVIRCRRSNGGGRNRDNS
eukprot:427079_1